MAFGKGRFDDPFFKRDDEDDLEIGGQNIGEAPIPATTGFDYPEYEFEDFDVAAFEEGFEERKIEPLDLSGISRQARQRQAITGVEPSAAFISGIAEPALKEKTREAGRLQELESIRRREERKQEFAEYTFETGLEYKEFAAGRDIEAQEYFFEKDIAFKEWALEQQLDIERDRLEMEKIGMITQNLGIGGCCFIFIEAYSELLPIVRRYRDEHMTDKNRRGYYKVADKIVPLMKKSKVFKQVVKFFMTDPMVSYGKYFYGQGRVGIIFKPITKFWLSIFNLLGGKKKYVRSNGEAI